MPIICSLLTLYVVVLFAAIVISWFPIAPGSALASVHRVLWQLTEPVLSPIRRRVPAVQLGGMGLDLSPFIVLLGITIIQRLIGC